MLEEGVPSSPRVASAGARRGWVSRIFLDAERARLRTWARLVVQSALGIASALAGGGLVYLLGASAGSLAVGFAIQIVGVVLSTLACARWLDHRPLVALVGRPDRAAILEALLGVAIGIAAIAFVSIAELGLGLARYTLLPIDGSRLLRLAAAKLLFVGVAVEEELWFRGYQLTNLAEGLEARVGRRASRGLALALSAVVFGLAHAGNPHASWLSTANVAIAGILLGVTFALTGRLWLAIGLHFAWNTAQAVLGMPVSGQGIEGASLFHREVLGDALYTGGAFGPEGGLLGLCAMAFALAACLIHARFALTHERARSATDGEPPRGS